MNKFQIESETFEVVWSMGALFISRVALVGANPYYVCLSTDGSINQTRSYQVIVKLPEFLETLAVMYTCAENKVLPKPTLYCPTLNDDTTLVMFSLTEGDIYISYRIKDVSEETLRFLIYNKDIKSIWESLDAYKRNLT